MLALDVAAIDYLAPVWRPDRIIVRVRRAAEAQARQRAPLDVESPNIPAVLRVTDSVGDDVPIWRQTACSPQLLGRAGQSLGLSGTIRPGERRPVAPRTRKVREHTGCGHGIVSRARRPNQRHALDDWDLGTGDFEARQVEGYREQGRAAHECQVPARDVLTVGAAPPNDPVTRLVQILQREL